MSEPSCEFVPPEVVEAFSAAAVTALEELVQIAAVLDDAPRAPHASDETCVLAAVRLARRLPGRLTLSLAVQTAEDLARRYLPPGAPLTEAIIDDVVGEFANVIAGQAKTALHGTPYHYTLTLPSVVRTRAADIPPAASAFALRFETGCLSVYLDLPPCDGA